MMENKKYNKKALKNEKNEICLNKQKQDQDTIVYPDTMTQLCILTQFKKTKKII